MFPEAVARWLDTWQRPAQAAAPATPAVVSLESVMVDGKPKPGGNSGRIFEGALYFGHPHFEWLLGQILLVQQVQAQLPKGQYLFELIHPQQNGLPIVSESGKYAVKLFIFDSWRTVLTDDRVPLDLFGRPLVVASRPFQLWPILLSKALLKVMAAYQILELQTPHEVCLTHLTHAAEVPVSLCEISDQQEHHEFGNCDAARHQPACLRDPVTLRDNTASNQHGLCRCPWSRGSPAGPGKTSCARSTASAPPQAISSTGLKALFAKTRHHGSGAPQSVRTCRHAQSLRGRLRAS